MVLVMDKIKECEDKTFRLDVTLHLDFGGHLNQFKDYYVKLSQIGFLRTGSKDAIISALWSKCWIKWQ